MSKTKLHIFDFDSTLVDTELPETGKKIWEEKTGEKWPHRGWWGRRESLDIDIFENKLVPGVYSDYRDSVKDEDAITVMMTGRMVKLSDAVEKILDKYGLEFDFKLYNTGGETFKVKTRQIEELLEKHPDVTDVSIYEDRPAHIERFKLYFNGLIKKGLITSYEINVVETKHF